MLRRALGLIALAAATVVTLAAPAWAHVEVDPEEAAAGSTQLLTFSVEFEGAATTGLEVQLPDGASVVQVPDKAGWTSSVDEAQGTVSWSGGSVAADDTFAVEVTLPDTTGVVLFPAIQTTVEGEEAWIGAEETEGEAGNPAPRLTLTAAEGTSTSTSTTAASTTTTESDLPGTTVEADERDDGDTSAAPWLIGAGIAALVAVVVGGLLLKRRSS